MPELASGFIVAIFCWSLFCWSLFCRALRVGELRTIGFEFADAESKVLWDKLKYLDFPVLVPHRPGREDRSMKEQAIRREHQLAPDAQVVLMEVHVGDPSDFYQNLSIKVVEEEKRYVIEINRCVSVAHAVAAVALEMSRFSRPPTLHFGWPETSLLEASWGYVVSGEGNIPWKVRELIHREQRNPARRPRVIVG